VAAPVLLLRGQQTLLGSWFGDAARHIVQHLVDPHLRELPAVGHFAPLLAPVAIAKEVILLFASAREQSVHQPA
jgi:pimeloyl-ACP methyl ester carboxylesterase